MPLDFYLANLQRIAPQLSALYRELLQRGEVSQTMRHAVLSPLYKEKGERHDPKRRLRAPPNKPTAASGPGGRWGV